MKDITASRKRWGKKQWFFCVLIVLVISVIVVLSLAFLITSDLVTNRFQAVTLEIALFEDNFDRLEPSDRVNLVPNKLLPKDPKVKNTNETDAFVFLKITVPVANVTNVLPDGTKQIKQPQELFYLKTNDDQQQQDFSFNTHPASAEDQEYWVELPDHETGTDYLSDTRTYVFGYSVYLKPEEMSETLFDYVQLRNFLSREVAGSSSLTVKVEAFGIQADYLGEIQKNDGTQKAVLDSTTLSKAYAYIAANE